MLTVAGRNATLLEAAGVEFVDDNAGGTGAAE